MYDSFLISVLGSMARTWEGCGAGKQRTEEDKSPMANELKS